MLAKMQQVLHTGSWLLALLAVASVAMLVGGRMAEQTTPRRLVEGSRGHAVVRCCRAAPRARTGRPLRRLSGTVTGRLAAPLIDGPGAGLLGAAVPRR